ncbi:f9d56bb0-f5a4-46a0-b72b-36f8005d00ad [Sclerotinia trifoliorum]|uniref:F9d56bb0-f5a4-46a0-b72b-36f8005d00ad n=1 Tax=Sclerotinia trifoliorum TaxID=28548 RepID=A0A8H2VQ14_9HELO|nr:f9d56bb0-f5a4-46a0-b72b-36f8005d00ad [Sclerotinia trifoliorum]
MSFPSQTLSFSIRSKYLNEDSTGPLIEHCPSADTPESATIKSENLHSTKSEDLIPDIELMPLPTSAMDDMEENQSSFSKIGIFCILATICNPQSRGSVRLTSSSPSFLPRRRFRNIIPPNGPNNCATRRPPRPLIRQNHAFLRIPPPPSHNLPVRKPESRYREWKSRTNESIHTSSDPKYFSLFIDMSDGF